jgi:hypothetical protein
VLGILIANCAGLSKYINCSLVERAGVVIEVAILANRLLKQLGDVLGVSRSDAAIGLPLC